MDVGPDLAKVGARLRDERVGRGLNQTDFAKLGGVGLTSQQQYESGKTPPPSDYLLRLARHDVDVASVLMGSEREPAGAHDRTLGFAHRPGSATSKSGVGQDLIEIGEIDLAYGFGGTFSDMPVEAEIVRFDRAWVETITRTPPVMLTFARGRGDSMQPTLLDGDIVLIDRSIRTVREQDAIWALTIGDIAMIKRVRMRGERVSLLSDNDRVPPDDYHHEEVNVIGRVIFIGRKI